MKTEIRSFEVSASKPRPKARALAAWSGPSCTYGQRAGDRPERFETRLPPLAQPMAWC